MADSSISNPINKLSADLSIVHTPEQVDLRRGYKLDERQILNLDGRWRCMPDPDGKGVDLGFNMPDYDVSGGWFNLPGKRCWREVTVPCSFNTCGSDINRSTGTIWFRKDFDIPESWTDKHVTLQSECISGILAIWLNGTLIAEGIDGIKHFGLDISECLNRDTANTLVLEIDETASETSIFDYGIIGSVDLIASNHFFIKSAEFEIIKLNGSVLDIKLNVSVSNQSNETVTGRILTEIIDGNGLMAGCYLAELDSVSPLCEKSICIEEATDQIISASSKYTANIYLLTDDKRVDYIQIHADDIYPDEPIISSPSFNEYLESQEHIRQRIDLTGEWLCCPDFKGRGEESGFYKPDLDLYGWRSVNVPCIYDDCGFDMRQYEGQAWFRKSFNIPHKWIGRKIILRFEGIHWRASIWLNGKFICEHMDGLLRLDLDITDYINIGDNCLVVRTDNTWRLGDRSPGSMTGYFADGGITREIELIAMDHLYLQSVNILKADTDGTIDLKIDVSNTSYDIRPYRIKAEITDYAGNVCWKYMGEPSELGTDNKDEIVLHGKADNIIPWSPDNPSMYIIRVSLVTDIKSIDREFYRFGFRKIEVNDKKLYLNGNPIFLYGTDIHEDSHRTGMAVDLETLRKDIIEMKRTGINFVRMAHAPRGPSALDLYDELGMMVLAENNLHWWMRDCLPYADIPIPNEIGPGNPRFENTVATVKRQIRKMIERDMNHPSIIMWSVGNENHVDKPGVQDSIAGFLQLAKNLDPSRPVVHVCCHYYQGLDDFTHDDIICINGYFTDSNMWREQIQKLHIQYPGKPVLITEFGFVGILGEHKQAETMKSQFVDGMVDPYLCGACVYSWVDVALQEWENAYEPVNGAYGIASRWREKREAVAVVRKMYDERRKHNASGAGDE
ncbi:MAG: glycoside hydrolase family 2 protein [Armatimonadota bacterium]